MFGSPTRFVRPRPIAVLLGGPAAACRRTPVPGPCALLTGGSVARRRNWGAMDRLRFYLFG